MSEIPNINKDISDIIYISNLYGNDVNMVQAGGGNVSVKTDNCMWIKTSGVMLKEIKSRNDLVCVDLNKISSILHDDRLSTLPDNQRDIILSKSLFSAVTDTVKQRCSIEIFLHSVMDKKFVIHTHPVYVNAMVCSVGHHNIAEVLFDESEYIWVPYKKPGYPLGYALYTAVLEHRKRFNVVPGIVFLQNHGLVIGGSNIEQVKYLTKKTIGAIQDFFGEYKRAEGIFRENSFHKNITFIFKDAIKRIAPAEFYEVRWSRCPYVNLLSLGGRLTDYAVRGALYPDQVVYCGERPLLLEKTDSKKDMENKLSAFFEKTGYLPRYVIVRGAGVFLVGENSNELNIRNEMIGTHLKTLMLILDKDKPLFIPVDESRYLAQWEAEKYRQIIAKNRFDK